MREIKFKVWDGDKIRSLWQALDTGLVVIHHHKESIAIEPDYDDVVLLKFTGLLDKNGKEIYEGDLLNIFFTSSNGEHIHDCIYEVKISPMRGIQFNFVKLLWVSYGYNQYPFSTLLASIYDNLDTDFRNQNYDKLSLTDKAEGDDYSNYFEVIGNVYDHLNYWRAKK